MFEIKYQNANGHVRKFTIDGDSFIQVYTQVSEDFAPHRIMSIVDTRVEEEKKKKRVDITTGRIDDPYEEEKRIYETNMAAAEKRRLETIERIEHLIGRRLPEEVNADDKEIIDDAFSLLDRILLMDARRARESGFGFKEITEKQNERKD